MSVRMVSKQLNVYVKYRGKMIYIDRTGNMFKGAMSFDNTIKPSQNLWLRTPLMLVSFSRLRLSGTIDLLNYAVVMMEALLDPGTLFPPVQIM